MPTEKKLTQLVINKVDSEETLKAMEDAGLINGDELYLVEDNGEDELVLDTTLTVEGGIPDSKAVGDRMTSAEGRLDVVEDRVEPMETKLAGIAAGATANTGTITGVSANGTSVATSGVANIPAASTSEYGVTKLSSSTSSTSTTLAATAYAVRSAYNRGSEGVTAAATAQSAADTAKSTADSALTTANAALPKAGGTMTGALTLAADPTSNLHAATKQYVDTKTASLVDSAPETLNTLNELAAALGDDPNFATTVASQIGTAQSTANSALDKANSIDGLPAVTTSDNDKFLRVVSGVWTAVVVDSAEEASF